MSFGDYLKKRRTATGLKQAEFARRIGVSQSYISLMEKGRSNPPSRVVCDRIAEVIGEDPAHVWLVARRGELPPADLGALAGVAAAQRRVPTAADRHFTGEVEKVMRLMGYRVSRAPAELGADLVAEVRTGVIVSRVLVMCRSMKRGEQLEAPEMAGFANMVASAREAGRAEAGVFVTDRGYSDEAHAVAAPAKIECLSYRELTNRIIDFDSYVDQLLDDYDASEMDQFYIDLSCKDRQGRLYKPMDRFFDEWLEDPDRNQVSILGDYGTGKTTYARKLAHDLALRYREDPTRNRIPIVVSLRDYAKAINMQQLITDLLINRYRVHVASYSTFEAINRMGRLVIIFDGFDEMATKVDKRITQENFRELSHAIPPHSLAKVVLTCRTHYFVDGKHQGELFADGTPGGMATDLMLEIEERPNFECVYLQEFDEEDIIDYLRRHFGDAWRDYARKINETYKLSDLTRRPLLLDIITRSLPRLEERGEEVTTTSLYRIYTSYWLQHEDWRSNLSTEERTFFMEEFAYQMHVEDRLSLHFRDLSTAIREHFKDRIDSPSDVTYFDNDIRTCSFLNRDELGNYKFTHKSFMEFFCGQKIARDLMAGNGATLKERRLSLEIARFAGDFLSQEARRHRQEGVGNGGGLPEGMLRVPGEDGAGDFWIDHHPVTNRQYQTFIDATGYPTLPDHWKRGQPPAGLQEHPVVYVSYYDAYLYARWAGKLLPTDREWERAAYWDPQRGVLRSFPWGDAFDATRCNTRDSGIGGTTPVDRYPDGASAVGALDMAGNVLEWCDSWVEGNREYRVVRGGAWSYIEAGSRREYRGSYLPDDRGHDVGFRCVFQR